MITETISNKMIETLTNTTRRWEQNCKAVLLSAEPFFGKLESFLCMWFSVPDISISNKWISIWCGGAIINIPLRIKVQFPWFFSNDKLISRQSQEECSWDTTLLLNLIALWTSPYSFFISRQVQYFLRLVKFWKSTLAAFDLFRRCF